jgi:hypothetical protein
MGIVELLILLLMLAGLVAVVVVVTAATRNGAEVRGAERRTAQASWT